MLADKIMETVRGEWFAASLISAAKHSDPHDLAARAKLLLATGPPGTCSSASLSPSPPPHPNPTSSAFLATFADPAPTIYHH